MATAQDRKYLLQWEKFRENTRKATPIDLNETAAERQKRIAKLEANPEAWFKYYFPNFYTSEPTPFHVRATKRVLANPEWYEVRSWSRELSKTGRTMMEVLYLAMTGKKKNILYVSSTYDDAVRFLSRYKSILEVNSRIINDYGVQEGSNWQAGEFITKKGVAFRGIGAGQSPRGTSNEEIRPDTIIIDDIDTDEECRNPARIKVKYKWIEEALYGTRSISEPLLWIALGNIIAEYCCIVEMGKVADFHEVINIRDAEGKSTWPSKNTEAHIDRVLGKMSWAAQQKEYYNNPVVSGDTFDKVHYGKCPPLSKCDKVVIYADPSTSNRTGSAAKLASFKSVGIVGKKGNVRYLYKIWLKQTGNAVFVSWLFEAVEIVRKAGVDVPRVWIENNSLQAPHYEQVISPEIKKRNKLLNTYLPITEDKRKKSHKFDRIEGTLQPYHSKGNLIFNIDQKDNPDMKVMDGQFLGVSPSAKIMDGPDMYEGAVWICDNHNIQEDGGYAFGAVNNRKY